MPSGEEPNVDRQGHDELYSSLEYPLFQATNLEDFRSRFESRVIAPFCEGGGTKGYVRGTALRSLLGYMNSRPHADRPARILDAGCGVGELTVYLASEGFEAVGLDVSSVAVQMGQRLARRLGIKGECAFIQGSLEQIPLPGNSIDGVIGFASLHHFIKYAGVPEELQRVVRPGGEAYFADSFGENPLYRVFHDREAMHRLGDVVLTRKKVLRYFSGCEVEMWPTDWFVMLDKLYGRILKGRALGLVRKISRVHYALDRKIPAARRLSLALSGSVMTKVRFGD